MFSTSLRQPMTGQWYGWAWKAVEATACQRSRPGLFSPPSSSLRTTVISASRSALSIRLFTIRSASISHRELEPVGGDRRVVVRPVVVRARVEGGAVEEERPGDLPEPVLLGALEEHVLEQVGHAGDPGVLVARPGPVPDAEADDRRVPDLLDEDGEAVREHRLLDARGEGRRGGLGGSAARAAPPAATSRRPARRGSGRETDGAGGRGSGRRHAHSIRVGGAGPQRRRAGGGGRAWYCVRGRPPSARRVQANPQPTRIGAHEHPGEEAARAHARAQPRGDHGPLRGAAGEARPALEVDRHPDRDAADDRRRPVDHARPAEHAPSVLQALEERFLFMLFLLRQPNARMVYVTSRPILPDVVDYYLGLLPGVIPAHARARFFNPGPARQLGPAALAQAARAPAAPGPDPGPDPGQGPGAPRALQHDGARARPRRSASASPCTAPILGISTLGTKSGCRKLFGRAGVSYPLGLGGSADSPTTSSPRSAGSGRRGPAIRLGDGQAQRGRLRAPATPWSNLEGLPPPGDAARSRRARRRGSSAMKFESAAAALRPVHGQARRAGGDRRGARGRRGDPEPQRAAAHHARSGSSRCSRPTIRCSAARAGRAISGCRFPADPGYATLITREAVKVGAGAGGGGGARALRLRLRRRPRTAALGRPTRSS